MLERILWVLLFHYIADYPLQGDFLASTKGKYFYSLFAHSMIYGLFVAFCFNFIGAYAPYKAFVLVGTHLLIDYVKSHAKNQERALKAYLYIDQALHISINLILAFI